MKILLLTDRMDAGGAETHIAQLARGLTEQGNEVWLLSSGGRAADALAKAGVRILFAPFHSHTPLALLRSYRILRRLLKREQFDVLHAHARVPAFLLRFFGSAGIARIVSVHARFHTNALLGKLCYWGDFTIAVGEDLRAYLCHAYGVPTERVRVIPNGIDCRRFSPPVPDLRTDAPSILFASRMDNDCSRGAELLCALAPSLCQRFPGVRITIAGGGNRYAKIRRLAERANQQLGYKAIEVLGWVDDMPKLLGQYDIFVGVSRAALEAAACGSAVILCGNQGYSGILTAATAKSAALSNFCARGDGTATSKKLERDLAYLIEHPAERKRFAQEARVLVEQHFNADRMCRETLAVYHRFQITPKRNTIVIGGYFGCGNLGDDAILLGFLEGLHAIAPHVKIIALTGSPHSNHRRFGIPCVNRKNPFSIRRTFLRADAFFCGGGSLLQNITSQRSLSYYLSLLSLANRKCCSPLLYAAGIGPIKGNTAIQKTLTVLSKCPYISLRDESSAQFLSTAGIDAAHLHLGADPACLLPLPPPTRAAVLLKQYRIDPKTKLICVVLNGNTPRVLLQKILSALRIVCQKQLLKPLFLVLDRPHDYAITQKASAVLKGYAVAPHDPGDAIAAVSAARAVVTLRLHALIFATLVKIPALGIAANPSDEKIASFARAAGQEFLAPDRLTVPALVEAIEALLANRQSRIPILTDAATGMRRAAHADLQRICDFLERPK